MELRQIRYYIEVVDQGSFTQAAEACFISQSAISQQVRALEEELGLPLLLRQGRSFSLTPAGDYFYRKAKAWQGGLEDIVRETQRRADWGERVLRVGFACNYAGRELYQAIAAFAQQCPQTVVQVVTGTHEELYDLLRFDGVDVKINEQRRAFSQAYENLPLAYRPTVAEVCAHGGPARQGLPVFGGGPVPCPASWSPHPSRRSTSGDYYHTTLGFGARFLSAPHLRGRPAAGGGQPGHPPPGGSGARPKRGQHRLAGPPSAKRPAPAPAVLRHLEEGEHPPQPAPVRGAPANRLQLPGVRAAPSSRKGTRR